MTDRYVIGALPRPRWTHKRLMQRKRADGTTAFEWWYPDGRIITLDKGDALLYIDGRVYPHYNRSK